MKRIISFLLVIIISLGILAGCSLLPGKLQFCEVKFYVDGEIYETRSAAIGKTVGAPKNPEKENYIFTGWKTDGLISYMYDFSSKVITNMNLEACFTLDTVKVGNLIGTKTIHSTVRIASKAYNVAFGSLIETESVTSYGSGVIIDVSGGYCYVLTNAHVVDKDEYSKQKINVIDVYGNSYEASIYKNSKKPSAAVSTDYDLALLYFKLPEEHTFAEIEMGSDPKNSDFVVSIGNPQGLLNSVTYGKVLNYQRVNGAEGSAADMIQFDTILHDCPIDHGSSGGALVDPYGRLVGINFAGYREQHYGCAIPVSKIIEFLDLYVY